MSFAARIQDGRVVEVVELPNGVSLKNAFHANAGFVDAAKSTEIGMLYVDGEFAPAPDPGAGDSPPPASISDRQFAQQLAVLGTISEAEALAWAARGELPDALEAAIAALPEPDRFAARMLMSSATFYERSHPLVATLSARLGYDAAALDAIWRAAVIL